ncbi:hypothetical protein [Hyalangium minutum]|uniref:Lipoprotein n=1 Tax=Hyalangium minutum TaxID=394096 RepID=A0A085WRT3_9BACT|nr:hypothetical protein [Hyalangium minutum]KFE70396.1 hypothetical protein DB31_5438 [Hyalangium minutum]
MRSPLFVLALGLISPAPIACAGEMTPTHFQQVSLESFKTTEGVLKPGQKEGQVLVDVPKMRAVVPSSSSSVAELHFTYLGPTRRQLPLASGENRLQVGLKLRAQDACNLAYVMWRLAPEPGLVVSIKSNPGDHDSDSCGNRGYTNLEPRQAVPVPLIVKGDSHVLRAEQEGKVLRVFADGILVWEGELPREALALKGPVGLRSDNGRFELEMFALQP